MWGGNPSVTWNSYVQRWLITWHSWEPFDVMLSSSTDLLHWAPAVRIVVVSTLCHVQVLLVNNRGNIKFGIILGFSSVLCCLIMQRLH